MVTEEIITGLRNAIEHGESLQDAMQIMMNSGYSPIEVQEASKYVGGGSLHLQQPKPDEHLVMPEQKSRISNMAFWKNQKPVQQPRIIQTQKVQTQQQPMQKPRIQQPQHIEQFPVQQIPQYSQIQQPTTSLTKQLEKIKPPKSSHIKEISLLIILLILIGTLIATIIFKDAILAWFA